MAEPNKNIQKPQTGADSTVPVSSVSEPVEMQTQEVATPQVVDWPNLQEEQVLRESNTQVLQEPVTPEPTQAPEVNIQPQVTVQQPQEQVKIEESKPIQTEAPKQPVWKVETAQDIKTQEIENEDLTNELNEKKKSQVMQEFQNMVQSGATIEEIGEFGLQNKQFARDINNVLRTNFKNTENTKYFWKYSTMSNQEMYEAYQNWDVVLWSEKFNLLPEEKKASFNQYVDQRRIANSLTKTDFTSSAKSTDLSNLESQIPKMFDSNVRKKYEEKLNNPRIWELKSQLTTNQFDIEDLDDKISNLEDDILEASPWISSVILWSEVRTRTRELLKEKNQLLRQRQLYLSEYDGLKSDAETELKLSMYEDEQARQDYQTQLSLYETRRKEQFQLWLAQTQREQQLEDRDFALKTQLQAEQRQRSFTVEMKELDQKLKNENPNGSYKVDRDWNMLYLVNGKATKVRDADWQVVWITQAKDYNDTIQRNTDGTYSLFRTYNDWRKPEMFNYGIDWESTYNTQIWVYDVLADIDSKPWKYFGWEAGKLQCWEAVNRYLKWVWITDIKVWDSYKSKKDVINNNVPQVGWLAIWNPVPEWEFGEFGHIWVVTWYNPDRWEVEITDWNKNGNWEKNTYTIPVSQVLNSDWGFRHLEGWVSTDTAWFEDSNIPLYKTFLNKGLTKAEIDTIDDFDAFKQQALEYSKSLTQQWTPQIKRIIELAQNLKENRPSRTQRLLSETPGGTLNANLADYQSSLQAFISNNALGNLVQLKKDWATFGALSNQELQFLEKSATELSSGLSDKKFDSELDRIIELLSKWLWEDELTNLWVSQTSPISSFADYQSYKQTATWNTQVNQDILDLYSNN